MALSLKEKLKLALGDKTKEPFFNQGFMDGPVLRTGPSEYEEIKSGSKIRAGKINKLLRIFGPGNHGLNDKKGRIRINRRTRN